MAVAEDHVPQCQQRIEGQAARQLALRNEPYQQRQDRDDRREANARLHESESHDALQRDDRVDAGVGGDLERDLAIATGGAIDAALGQLHAGLLEVEGAAEQRNADRRLLPVETLDDQSGIAWRRALIEHEYRLQALDHPNGRIAVTEPPDRDHRRLVGAGGAVGVDRAVAGHDRARDAAALDNALGAADGDLAAGNLLMRAGIHVAEAQRLARLQLDDRAFDQDVERAHILARRGNGFDDRAQFLRGGG